MPAIVKSIFQTIKRSAFIKLVLKLGLTLGALWLVFYEIDFSRLEDLYKTQQQSLLVPSFVLLSIQAVLGGIRWRVILKLLADKGTRLFSTWQAIRICYIGMFFNNCLPGGTVGGDAVRIWITKANHVPLSLSIHSVIIDRIMALVALGIMVIFSLPLLGGIAGFDGMAMVPLTLLAAVAGLWLALKLRRFFERYSHIHILNQLYYFTTNVKTLLLSPQTTAIVLVYAISGHVMFCMATAYIAGSLHLNLSMVNALVLVPPVALMATLPISVGGWGVRELAMIGMLGMIGIRQEEALIVSLEMGVMGIITGLPGGLLWLFYRGRDKASEAGKHEL